MTVSFGQVGAPSSTSAADGTNLPVVQGKQGDAVTAQMHGTYFTQTYRGNCFWGSTAAAGLTLGLVTTSGAIVALLLWNPQGSGKNAVLMACTITGTTAATTADGYGYAFIPKAGASTGLAGAAPFTVFTQITATRGNSIIGQTGQLGSVCLLGSGATTTATTGQPLFIRAFGASIGTGAITAFSVMPSIREDFDGTLIIPPDTAFLVGTTITTSGQTATQVSLTWLEVPL